MGGGSRPLPLGQGWTPPQAASGWVGDPSSLGLEQQLCIGESQNPQLFCPQCCVAPIPLLSAQMKRREAPPSGEAAQSNWLAVTSPACGGPPWRPRPAQLGPACSDAPCLLGEGAASAQSPVPRNFRPHFGRPGSGVGATGAVLGQWSSKQAGGCPLWLSSDLFWEGTALQQKPRFRDPAPLRFRTICRTIAVLTVPHNEATKFIVNCGGGCID